MAFGDTWTLLWLLMIPGLCCGFWWYLDARNYLLTYCKYILCVSVTVTRPFGVSYITTAKSSYSCISYFTVKHNRKSEQLYLLIRYVGRICIYEFYRIRSYLSRRYAIYDSLNQLIGIIPFHAWYILVNVGSRCGLLPDDSKTQSEPI